MFLFDKRVRKCFFDVIIIEVLFSIEIEDILIGFLLLQQHKMIDFNWIMVHIAGGHVSALI